MPTKPKSPGRSIIEAAEEALRFTRGEDTGARVWQVPVLDTTEVRKKTKLSQEEFAQRFRINLGTLRNWEQGVRQPEGPARVLLMVIDQEPEAVYRALKAWKPKQVDASYGRPKQRQAARAKAETVRTPKKRKRD
jgi:putative transcriptional regulator